MDISDALAALRYSDEMQFGGGMDAFEALLLLEERRQWEADQAAVAEYESWQVQVAIAEQDAEGIAER